MIALLRLTFGTFRLCHECSIGNHRDHKPVMCQCDLCGEQ